MTFASAMAFTNACAGRGEAPLVGVSHGMPQNTMTDAGAPSPAFFVDGGMDMTGLSRLSPEGYASVGHASGRFTADVFANAVAESVFKQGAGSFPTGSVLVMTHHERRAEAAEGGATGPTFRMEKTAAGWRFATVSKTGTLLAEGTPDSCVACHEDAARDHVFPLLLR